MAVLRPLRVVIDNYPEGQVEEMDAVNNPEDASAGTRKVPFSRVLYIEQDDFREDPPKQYYRLSPGREVRLRYGYFITCTGVVKNERGEVVEIHCTYDPATRGGNAPDGRKVKSTIHWVSAAARRRRRGAALREPLHQGEPQRYRAGPGFHRQPESEVARSVDRRQAGAVARRRPQCWPVTSSSAWATSAWTPTPRPASRSSTARRRSATPGPKSKSGKRAASRR